MKKIIALLLAAMLLTSCAFAQSLNLGGVQVDTIGGVTQPTPRPGQSGISVQLQTGSGETAAPEAAVPAEIPSEEAILGKWMLALAFRDGAEISADPMHVILGAGGTGSIGFDAADLPENLQEYASAFENLFWSMDIAWSYADGVIIVSAADGLVYQAAYADGYFSANITAGTASYVYYFKHAAGPESVSGEPAAQEPAEIPVETPAEEEAVSASPAAEAIVGRWRVAVVMEGDVQASRDLIHVILNADGTGSFGYDEYDFPAGTDISGLALWTQNLTWTFADDILTVTTENGLSYTATYAGGVFCAEIGTDPAYVYFFERADEITAEAPAAEAPAAEAPISAQGAAGSKNMSGAQSPEADVPAKEESPAQLPISEVPEGGELPIAEAPESAQLPIQSAPEVIAQTQPLPLFEGSVCGTWQLSAAFEDGMELDLATTGLEGFSMVLYSDGTGLASVGTNSFDALWWIEENQLIVEANDDPEVFTHDGISLTARNGDSSLRFDRQATFSAADIVGSWQGVLATGDGSDSLTHQITFNADGTFASQAMDAAGNVIAADDSLIWQVENDYVMVCMADGTLNFLFTMENGSLINYSVATGMFDSYAKTGM